MIKSKGTGLAMSGKGAPSEEAGIKDVGIGPSVFMGLETEGIYGVGERVRATINQSVCLLKTPRMA